MSIVNDKNDIGGMTTSTRDEDTNVVEIDTPLQQLELDEAEKEKRSIARKKLIESIYTTTKFTPRAQLCQPKRSTTAPPRQYNPPMKLTKKQTQEKLTEQLLRLRDAIMPQKSEIKARKGTVHRIQKMIRQVFPTADIKVHLFGSVRSGLATKKADMDFCLTVDLRTLPQSFLTTVERKRKFGSDKIDEFPPLGQYDRSIKPPKKLFTMTNTEIIEIQGDLIRLIVDKIGEYCSSSGDYINIKPLPLARIPIVKLTDSRSKMHCDIGINNILALRNTELIETYLKCDDRVALLCMAVKHWAKQRSLNDPYHGSLSSYSYVIMVLHMLQRRKILPYLQQEHVEESEKVQVGPYDASFSADIKKLKWKADPATKLLSVGELLIEFFRYYGHQFSFSENVVCVRKEGVLTKIEKNWTSDKSTPRMKYNFCIEDPFEITHNLARVVNTDGLYWIRGEMMTSFEMLARGVTFDRVCNGFRR